MESDFRFLKLGPESRLALAGGLFLLGSALELLLGGLFPGLPVAALGWIPLLLRPATNRPDDQGLEEWRPVSMAELDRLDDAIRESRKLRRRLGSPANLAVLPAFVLLALGSLVLGRGSFLFFGANALVFFAPALFFGRVRVFLPRLIDRKLPSFRAVIAEAPPEGLSIVPYFRFDKDPEGRDIPEDLRLMLELKRPPADLVGIQLQTTFNKGPNGEVPYLYAVVLCRGRSGPSYAAARRLRAGNFEIEAGGDEDYGTVVLRQDTADGGYYTKPEDCRRLARLCYSFLGRLTAPGK